MAAPRRETARHLEAFEFWYADGTPRSYPEVAAWFTVSATAVKSWSRVFGWQDRAAQRRQAALAETTTEAVDDLAAKLKELRHITDMALTLAEKQLGEGLMRFSATDLDKVVRLVLFLHGEPDSRSEILSMDVVTREIQRLEAELTKND